MSITKKTLHKKALLKNSQQIVIVVRKQGRANKPVAQTNGDRVRNTSALNTI